MSIAATKPISLYLPGSVPLQSKAKTVMPREPETSLET